MARLPYTNFHDLNLDFVLKVIKKAFTPDNPPPYPVKSVNGLTGDVIVTGDVIPLAPNNPEMVTDALREKQDAPASPGSPGQVLGLDANQTPVWLDQTGVTDVKIDQSSIVDQDTGVAVIPIASSSDLGVIKTLAGRGIRVDPSTGVIFIYRASDADIKSGSSTYAPLTPSNQEYAVFYGLASAAGLSTASSLTMGTYTNEAIDKILTMLGVYNRILSPAGNTHTLLPCPFSYAFGEKAELNITVTANSEYHFSFSCPVGTPTVLTMTGVTDTSGDVILEAGGYYEINVWNGVALYRKIEVTGG